MSRLANRLAILWAVAGVLLLSVSAAWSQTDVRIGTEDAGEVIRIEIIYPESSGGDLLVDAEIVAGAVLQARFSEPIRADATGLSDILPDLIARARIDPDGSILRIALNREVEPRVSISHNLVAIDLAAPGTEPLPDIVSPYEIAERRAEALAQEQAVRAAEDAARPLPPLPMTVAYGEASEYTRIEFNWPEAISYELNQDGDVAELSFERAAEVNLSELTGRPPRLVDSVTNTSSDRSFSLRLELDPDVEARIWDEGRRVILDLTDPAALGAEELLSALNDYAQAQQAALEEEVDEVGDPVTLETAEETPTDSADDTTLETTDDGSQSEGDQTDNSENSNGEANTENAAQDIDSVSSDIVETPEPVAQSESDPVLEETNPTTNPVPEDGIVRGSFRSRDDDLVLTFDWNALPGAAVYKRGGAYWIVFDASAALLTDPLDGVVRQRILDVESWRGDDFSAMRLATNRTTQIDIQPDGTNWVLTLADVLETAPRSIVLTREVQPREPALIDIELETLHDIVEFMDPLVGDRLWIVTSDGPKAGVITERQFLEAGFLPSVQGLAIRPLTDDLTISRVPGGAHISRPGGLSLTRPLEELEEMSSAPVSPAAFDFASWRGTHPYREERQILSRQASSMDPDDLLDLARFYLAWEMAPETLGTLNLVVESRPRQANDARINAMRGAASYMMGRLEEARRYFTVPQLINDPSAQNWLGLIAVDQSNWAEARRRFAAGEDNFFYLSDLWRARIHAARARAAMEANDLAAAELGLLEIDDSIDDPWVQSEADFIHARLAQAKNENASALTLYETLSQSDWEPIQARALLEKVRLEFDEGTITPDEGVEQLESLRYRWRGDRTEIEASRLLGELYARAGRYPEALNIMDGARQREPGSALSRRIQTDMDGLFRRLFLEDEANEMDPLEAVALWYEYSDLTPQGEEGQRMVRRIAERLVSVDLLDPAADLLEHQVFELTSITGFAKAQIASDLAVIYLMAERHEDALRVLQRTRISGLTRDIVTERRLLEARALTGLARMDQALELISMDQGPEADRLRADIAWERREWALTGRRLEALLGDRWQSSDALSAGEAHDVLRASISYALSGDTLSVARLRNRFGSSMEDSRFASAFQIVSSDVSTGRNAQLVDLVNELGDMEPVDSFMAGFAERFDNGPES